MKRIPIIFITLILMLNYGDAFSLSCMPHTERIVAECKNGNCNRGIYVYEVPSRGACGRRPVVREAYEWQLAFIQKFIKYLPESKDKLSVYELSYELDWYLHEDVKSENELVNELVSTVMYTRNIPDLLQNYIDTRNTKLLDNPVFYKLLNEKWASYTGRGLVELSSISLTNAEEHWREKEKQELYKYQKWKLFDRSLYVVGWAILIVSVIFFFRNINRFYRGNAEKRKITVWLSLQGLLFLFSLYWFLFHFWAPLKLATLGPIVVMVWVIEFVFFLVKKIQFKKLQIIDKT